MRVSSFSSSSATAPLPPGLTVSLPVFFSSLSESNFPTVSVCLCLSPSLSQAPPCCPLCILTVMSPLQMLSLDAPQTSSWNQTISWQNSNPRAMKTCTRSLSRPLVLFLRESYWTRSRRPARWCHTGTLSHRSRPHSPQSVTSSVYIRGLVIVGGIFCDFWCRLL